MTDLALTPATVAVTPRVLGIGSSGSDLTVTVYTFPTLVTPDGTQPVWTAASARDVLADAGSGEATYPNAEAVPYGKLLQYALKGVVFKTIFASAYDRTAVSSSEEEGAETTVSGIECQLDQLAKARVHPANGLDRMPRAEDRIGDYTDPFCFDDSGWSGANDLWSVDDAAAVWDAAHPDEPIVFRDRTARVLGVTGDTTTDAALGKRYFRQAFSAPYDGAYFFEFGGDDVAEFFVDGVPVGSTDQRQNWTHENAEIVELSAGGHVIAWTITNMPWAAAGANACGGAWALWTPGFDSATLVAHSDSSAVAFGPQDDTPGMTAGRFMKCLIDDSIASGFLAPFVNENVGVYSWDEVNDSNGDPWPEVVPSTKVSTDLLTCFTKDLAAYVELAADPTQWLLHAYIAGGKGGASGVDLDLERNITSLTQRGEQLTASGNMMALDAWGGGWTSTGTGDEETFVDLGTIYDRAEVDRVATNEVFKLASGINEQITVTYEPDDDSELPYVTAAYETGAVITAPDSFDSPASARIQSITVSDSADIEHVQVTVEVGEVVLRLQERLNNWLKKMVF